MDKKRGRRNATGKERHSDHKQQYNSDLTCSSDKMGHHNSCPFRHSDASILHFGVQKRTFLDPDAVFIQCIKHRRKAPEIEVFLLENQVYMNNFYRSHN